MKPERREMPDGGYSEMYRLPDNEVRILVYDKDGKLVQTVYGKIEPPKSEEDKP